MDDLESKEEMWLNVLNKTNNRLEAITNEDAARLPEKIFAGVFVPIFAGEDSLYNNVSMETWVNFAGGPYRRVDIVGSRGEVIFTVPPIFERGNVKTIVDSTRNNSVFHMVLTAQQYARVHPKQGEAYLKDSLSKRTTMLSSPINLAKNLEFWNMVFKRYGRPEITVVTNTTADAVVENILDMGEFESL
jgi:hypothetical protein